MSASFERDPFYLLVDVARLLRTRADQLARRRGMTRAQWVILVRLQRQPGMTQNEMAALVEVEPISVARLVDRLQARGLVERRHDPSDRRVWRLHLTPAAAPFLDEIAHYKEQLSGKLLAGLSAAQLEVWTTCLLQMKATLMMDELIDMAEPPRAVGQD